MSENINLREVLKLKSTEGQGDIFQPDSIEIRIKLSTTINYRCSATTTSKSFKFSYNQINVYFSLLAPQLIFTLLRATKFNQY